MNTNIVVVGGNITRDIELRYTPAGKAVAEVGIANNKKWKNEAGDLKEEVCFINVTAWGTLAETMAKYLKKGDGILVEGRLKQEVWEKNGEKRSAIKITADKASWFYDGKGVSEKTVDNRTGDESIPY